MEPWLLYFLLPIQMTVTKQFQIINVKSKRTHHTTHTTHHTYHRTDMTEYISVWCMCCDSIWLLACVSISYISAHRYISSLYMHIAQIRTHICIYTSTLYMYIYIYRKVDIWIYHKSQRVRRRLLLLLLSGWLKEFILSIGYKLKTMKSIDWHFWDVCGGDLDGDS